MTSSSKEEATDWVQPILLIWPVLMALQYHFLIIYTKRYAKKSLIWLIPIYLFALITAYFSRFELPVELSFSGNIWKRIPLIGTPLTSFVLFAYATGIYIISIYLVVSFYKSLKFGLEKYQSLLIFLGLLLPGFINTIKNGPLPAMGIEITFPEANITFFGWILFAIAIWRYKVFDITPKTVADKIIETIKDGLLLVESSGKVVTANNAFYNIFKKTSEEVLQNDIDKVLGNLTLNGENKHNSFLKNEIDTQLFILKVEDDIPLFINVTSSFLYDEQKNVVGSVLVLSDITLVYTARQEIEKKQKQMTEMAHHAGMAMMAADVMHNIGNIMNSINVSSERIMTIAKTTKLNDLHKANLLFYENKDRLPDYFKTDSNANLLPEYYQKVTSELEKEYEIIKNEGQVLLDKNKLIKDSINIQMDVVGARNFSEQVIIGTLINEVVAIQDGRISKYKIDIQKDFEIPSTTAVEIYKSKLLNVLLNVFQNALQAVFQNEPGNRKVSLLVKDGGNDKIQIEISDNGMGIKEEIMGNIFTHGFTTKEKGHGFGLHFCAYTMKELNGGIEAFSEGEGMGAKFVITFSSAENE